jgi:transposase-like protein
MNIVNIYRQFPTEADCIAHIERVRWHGKPVCPYCTSTRVTSAPKEARHHCNACNTTFSATVNTIFHHTHLDLQIWFLAISLILNAKKGISGRQLARDLEVNKNTGWYIGMRVRNAMFEQGDLLKGIVEMDECYIGGKPRKGTGPHKRGRGTSKAPVVGMIERGGNVVARPVDKSKLNSKSLARFVREHVDVSDAMLITDEYKGYVRIKGFMPHAVINHQISYADGIIHTNAIEGFWSLLKRGMIGQYHKVSLRHLHQYVNEFCYRYNGRNNPALFDLTIARGVGAA